MDAGQLRDLLGDKYSQLHSYHDLLLHRGIEWGLLGPNEADRIWERHILNSLALEPLCGEGVSVLDVGSGAGLPGLVLAIYRPDLRVTLLDSKRRRTDFLNLAVSELGVHNVNVVRDRVEDYPSRADYPGGFDIVTCRALSGLLTVIRWCLPLLNPDGVLLSMRGESAADEVGDVRNRLQMAVKLQLAKVDVPGTSERTRVVIASRGDGPLPYLGMPQMDYIY
ncbi:MAG: 16S rRNA (guanine(527)-N(7))-methyltransferase RsmG [Propionibacteriaceae bacterium]|jgi:16S rRNA (guanine527-N7)-methyltransferase|nr:16S rRNA (guanine(527)-N(7))-methyltransferase RsmG [Propionibacteriaceae bacterium]